jgi:hypothetical protein
VRNTITGNENKNRRILASEKNVPGVAFTAGSRTQPAGKTQHDTKNGFTD